MIELKFRVWDIKEKVMHKAGFLIDHDGTIYDNTLCDGETQSYPFGSGQTILMQSTGLKDEMGAKIFEGDIIMLSNSSDSTILGNEIGVVEFMENRACWHLDTGAFNDWTQLNREIIGNIYENPELLKKK